MQTLEQALENLVHNMEILRDTLNKQHKTQETIQDNLSSVIGNTLDFIRDDISELDTKINEIDSKLNSLDSRISYVFSELNEVKEKIDALGR